MNINLTNAAAAKKKELTKTVQSNVFGDDGDDDDYDAPSSRAGVNQAVRSEQDALKLRAQKAIQMSEASLYDYDGAYDSFQKETTTEQEKTTKEDDRKSRYIADLLEAAKKRKHEKDIIYEKKIAREQAVEDAEEDFRGKEKFITAAYRKKLEERELWLAQDERQRKKEEENDVTKQASGLGMANFYGNLSNNVALGGIGETENSISVTPNQVGMIGAASVQSGDSQDKRRDLPNLSGDMGSHTASFVDDSSERLNKSSNDIDYEKQDKYVLRDQKVKEALERYRIRKGLLAQ